MTNNKEKGYYILKLKRRPNSPEYDAEFNISDKHIEEIEQIVKYEDHETCWVNDNNDFSCEWDIKFLYLHLKDQYNYFKFSHWWEETEIAYEYKKQSSYAMNNKSAEEVFAILKNKQMDLDLSSTMENVKNDILENEYTLSLRSINGKPFNIKLTERSIEEFVSIREKMPMRVSQIEKELNGLNMFAKKYCIDLSKHTGDSEDNYDKSYLELE